MFTEKFRGQFPLQDRHTAKMFAKLKKKIAEETAIAQRPGSATRISRSVSKESVASMGADSGDDFVSIFPCFDYLTSSVYTLKILL